MLVLYNMALRKIKETKLILPHIEGDEWITGQYFISFNI